MLELCDRRLGTTVRASAVDDDVNLISNLISTDASKRDTGSSNDYVIITYVLIFGASM